MFMDRKIQYCQDFSSSQLGLGLQIKCKPNQNPSNLFCEYWRTDSKVSVEKQKTQNSQHNNMKENNAQKLILTNFKTHYKATVIKTV